MISIDGAQFQANYLIKPRPDPNLALHLRDVILDIVSVSSSKSMVSAGGVLDTKTLLLLEHEHGRFEVGQPTLFASAINLQDFELVFFVQYMPFIQNDPLWWYEANSLCWAPINAVQSILPYFKQGRSLHPLISPMFPDN